VEVATIMSKEQEAADLAHKRAEKEKAEQLSRDAKAHLAAEAAKIRAEEKRQAELEEYRANKAALGRKIAKGLRKLKGIPRYRLNRMAARAWGRLLPAFTYKTTSGSGARRRTRTPRDMSTRALKHLMARMGVTK
jgi:hypothetical protein